jgi:hypothetical protein
MSGSGSGNSSEKLSESSVELLSSESELLSELSGSRNAAVGVYVEGNTTLLFGSERETGSGYLGMEAEGEGEVAEETEENDRGVSGDVVCEVAVPKVSWISVK